MLFRSEEHIHRWRRAWNQPIGGLLSPEQAWELARAWYSQDRREHAWRRKTKAESQEIFNRLGLSSPFWQL